MKYEELSKEISYALRHAPWEYGIELDQEGWVEIACLLEGMRKSKKWKQLEMNDIEKMIETSSKKRHEINQNSIRAFYGHSVPKKIIKKEMIPPVFLYHGTTHEAISSILEEGLEAKSRQYVHLSQDIETAIKVGERRDKTPIILVINSEQASKDGIKFYPGNEKIWLSEKIPSNYIHIYKK